MGEPLLHPLLPVFIRIAREKGFRTVLTSNGTLLDKALNLMSSLPHKVQLSLHSHESNGKGKLDEYINKVMQFAIPAAEKGTCVVLRLWNQGGRESENEQVMQLLEQYVKKPWRERPDGYRLCDNLYLEFDRKFKWPMPSEITETSPPRGSWREALGWWAIETSYQTQDTDYRKGDNRQDALAKAFSRIAPEVA